MGTYITSLDEDGNIGIYKSILNTNCVYCGERVELDQPVVYIMSEKRIGSDSDTSKLYFVECHLRCSSNLRITLEVCSEEPIPLESSVSISDRIVCVDNFETTLKCVVCDSKPSKEHCIIFSSVDNKSKESVWCHKRCAYIISKSLESVTKHTNSVLASEI